jgi:hypothetical protein
VVQPPQLPSTDASRHKRKRRCPPLRAPLNNQGKTRLKPVKNAKHKSTRTPKRLLSITATLVAPAVRQYKHSKRPSSEVRLARGIDAPLGRVHPTRGFHAPSGGVRPARGFNPPLERGPPRSRA